MIATEKPPLEEAFLAHISFKPWSAYTPADYTIEQWHKACLIHQHTGAPTSKSQCKLPVRTPLGALNKNGVQAAKAALNGARGGVDATPDEKAKAKAQLDVLSKQLESKVPAFLAKAKHDGMSDEDILAHFGVRGMKWGVRRDRSSGPRLLPGARSSMAVGRKVGEKINSARNPDPNKKKMSTGKKVAIGATAAAGAAAVAYLLSKSGRNKVGSVIAKMAEERSNARNLKKAEAATQARTFQNLRANNPFSEYIRTRNNFSRGRAGTDFTSSRDAIYEKVMKTKTSDISQSEWKSRVSSVLKDMKGANAEQDAYMRSIGLGAAVNAGG